MSDLIYQLEVEDGPAVQPADDHGIPSISVTRALRDADLVQLPPMKYLYALKRGRDVHTVCTAIAKGMTDYWTGRFPEIAAYAEVFKEFLDDYPVTIEACEQVVHHPMGYHGRLDLRGRWKKDPAVFEIKNGTPAWWHGLQLSAYTMAQKNEEAARTRRIAVYLQPGKPPKVEHYTKSTDFGEFLAALTVARLKRQHGVRLPSDPAPFEPPQL